MKEYPFKSSFAKLTIKPVISEDKDKYLALASLTEVSKFIPNIDTAKNHDLLPVAFNACVVNRVNKNTDVVDTQTALGFYKSFINKPINVEHDRQKVIGAILTAGFSEFGTDKPISEADASKLTKPFNITLGGVVWRLVAPDLADLIEEASDETSPNYQEVSASWELGFTGYRIALLEGGKKNLDDANEIIDDPEKVEEAQNKLIALGGDGKFKDLFAYRMPSYDVIATGIGFTQKPAAEVKGVATAQDEKVGQKEDPAFGKPAEKTPENKGIQPVSTTKNEVGQKEDPAFGRPADDKALASNNDTTKNNDNKISHSENSNVKIERKVMKLKSITDLTDASLKECTASVVTEFISEKIKEGSDSWEKQKTELNDQIAKASQKANQAEADYKKLQGDFDKMKTDLESLAKEKKDREAVEKFNSRMGELAEAYEFDDEARAAVLEDIKAIASDEEFNKYKAKAKVLYKGYAKKDDKKKKDDQDADDSKASKKAAKADDDSDDAEAKKKKAKASEQEAKATVDKALENAEKEKGGLPNGTTTTPNSLLEKYKTAFAKENIIITR